MVSLGATFDATQVDPTNEFEPLPPGQYEAEVMESRRESASKNDPGKGECLTLTWQVASGPLQGRLFWQRLNLWFRGQNFEKTCEIAQRQLSELCHAMGVMSLENSEQLHHRRVLVKYGPQKKNPQYSEVKSVKALGGGGQAVAGPAPAPAAAPASAAPPPQAAGAPPSGGGWKRRAG